MKPLRRQTEGQHSRTIVTPTTEPRQSRFFGLVCIQNSLLIVWPCLITCGLARHFYLLRGFDLVQLPVFGPRAYTCRISGEISPMAPHETLFPSIKSPPEMLHS